VACVAEIRQAKIQHRLSVTCLATGRTRCEVRGTEARGRVEVALLDDSGPGEVPREALGGSAALAPWVYLSFDPGRLARAAGRAFAEMSPLVHQPQCDPRMLSYWLSGNFPASWLTKQWLLSARNTSARLATLQRILRDLDCLKCRICGTKVVFVKDIFRPFGLDCGNIFVNSHGVGLQGIIMTW